MWLDCYPSEDTNEGETMNCDGCGADLSGKKKYFTLVCNWGLEMFTYPYCNPMCIAKDWKCLEAVE